MIVAGSIIERVREVMNSGVARPGPREAEWLVEAVRAGAGASPHVRESVVRDRALALARRRARGEPLQYLIGRAAFRHLDLAVGPGVFIPRPETELVVAKAIELLPAGGRAADIGTGSGAIALAISTERPDATVYATEVSRTAHRFARDNADAVGARVALFEGHLFDPLPELLRGTIDVVVSNPPYVRTEDREGLAPELAHEPDEALFGGGDGLAVMRPLCAQAVAWLRPGGSLVLEIGEDQAGVVTRLLDDASYGEVRVHADLAGRDRIVEARSAS